MVSKKPQHSEDPVEGLEDLLNEIDSQVDLTDISFESWCQYNDSLDLATEIVLSPAEAQAGGQFEVRITRSIETSQKRKRKETLVEKVQIPANSQNGSSIFLENKGDERSGKVGRLRIIVKIL